MGGSTTNYNKLGSYYQALLNLKYMSLDLFFSNEWDVKVELGGGFKYVLFSPLLGEMINFDYCFWRWVATTN